MADNDVLVSEAPASEPMSSSPRTCTGCKKPTKEHFGPYGKDKCVLTVLDALRLRVEQLEGNIVENESRHGQELAAQAAVHEKALDGLVAIIESLQDRAVDDVQIRSSTIESLGKFSVEEALGSSAIVESTSSENTDRDDGIREKL